MYEHEEDKAKGWPIYLAFAFLSIPLLIALFEERRDCYPEKSACETDWNAVECQPQPDPQCRYAGGTYRGFYGGHYYGSGGAGHLSGYNKGSSITRGGFGKFGKAFSGGG